MYKIIVWGLGKEFHQSINILKYYTMLRQIEIVALTAKTVPNVNMIDEYKVIKTEDIKNTEFDFVLIMSEKHFRNISQNLNSMGISNDKILRGKILNIPNMDFKEYVKLKQSKLTIVSNTCWGGKVYYSLGLECLSPFKNLFFSNNDYLKILNNFKYYMSIEPQFDRIGYEYNDNSYPILKIEDIDIHCNHEKKPEKAIADWNRRREKINYDNVMIEMLADDKEIAKEFCLLQGYENKVCFVPFEPLNDLMVKVEALDEQRFWQAANGTGILGINAYNLDLISLCNGKIKYRYS